MFVCADDEPDFQNDVLVVNFDGSNGFAHFEAIDSIVKVADSLLEYYAILKG